MFHVKRLVTGIVFLLSFSCSFAQYANYSYLFKPEPEIKIARDEDISRSIALQTTKTQLNDQEEELLYWMDFARKYPKRFYDEVVYPYIKTYPELMKQKKYAESLKNDLYNSNPLSLFVVDEKLIAMAKEHAIDVREHNNPSIAHSSSAGLSFQDRAKKFGLSICAAENLSYGASSVLMQLVLLYLDVNMPNLGHRKNLLNPLYSNIGIALIGLENNGIFFVQDFSCAP